MLITKNIVIKIHLFWFKIQNLYFFDVNYEFHEANHAIIDTFAVNIYFSLCADDRKTICLVSDKTFQI